MKELSLKKSQEQSLLILLDIDRVCKENNIKYCLMFGTLIGAIRHKGFIPWDDDIDIAILEVDYERFLETYDKKGKYRIINYKTEPKCPYMLTRISDDNFVQDMEFGPKYRIGTFVDVYPFSAFGNEGEIEARAKKCQQLARGLGRSLEPNIIKNISHLHRGIKKWFLIVPFVISKIRGSKYYRDKLLSFVGEKNFAESEYVGCALWNGWAEKEVYPKEWFQEFVDTDFEGYRLTAPKEYDKILRKTYGDYMQLPPEAERLGHHFYKIYTREDLPKDSPLLNY